MLLGLFVTSIETRSRWILSRHLVQMLPSSMNEIKKKPLRVGKAEEKMPIVPDDDAKTWICIERVIGNLILIFYYVSSSVSYFTLCAISFLHFPMISTVTEWYDAHIGWMKRGGMRRGQWTREQENSRADSVNESATRGFGPFPANGHLGSNKETWNAQCHSLRRTFFQCRKLRCPNHTLEWLKTASRKGKNSRSTEQAVWAWWRSTAWLMYI